jgi:hypothetical protein
MAKGMLHFTKGGVPYKGNVHKMKDGSIHTGKTHTKSSKPVVGQKMAVMLAKGKM